jgi:hypothetical protein
MAIALYPREPSEPRGLSITRSVNSLSSATKASIARCLDMHCSRTGVSLGETGVYRVRLVEKQTCWCSGLPAMWNDDERSSEHRACCG